MNPGPKLPPVVLWLVSVAVPALLVILWLRAAQGELTAAPESAEGVAVASMTDDTYCTADLKRVLRRVAGACGLLAGAGRGCQPSDAKTVAQMNDADFNALFGPMRDRTQIIQFDADDTSLDEAGRKAVERAWATQGGASFFFVVSRASPDGNKTHNLELSKARARDGDEVHHRPGRRAGEADRPALPGRRVRPSSARSSARGSGAGRTASAPARKSTAARSWHGSTAPSDRPWPCWRRRPARTPAPEGAAPKRFAAVKASSARAAAVKFCEHTFEGRGPPLDPAPRAAPPGPGEERHQPRGEGVDLGEPVGQLVRALRGGAAPSWGTGRPPCRRRGSP
jgi:hypothetical protein